MAQSHGTWILLLRLLRPDILSRPLMMVALWLVMMPVVTASAQVSGDLLPDPIGSSWLTRQLRTHVAPSVVEWIEIENAHEAYLDSFRILQEGELARYRVFLEESMAGIPDGQTIRKFIRKLDGLRDLIEVRDSVLFSEIEEILEEPKRASLARIRNLRALKRLSVAYGSSQSDRAVPLWSILDDWEEDLPPERRTPILPVLIAYEADLVAALEAWRRAQDQMLIALTDELNRGGINRIESSNPDSEAMKAFQEALRVARLKTTNAAAAVSRVNERVVRSLQDVATPLDHRRIRTAHQQLLTKGVVSADPLRFVSTLERMLSVDDLDPSLREELLAAFMEYAAVDDRHVRMMIELIESEETPDRGRLESFSDVRDDLAGRFRQRLDRIAEDSGRSDLRTISRSGGLRDRDDESTRSSEDLSIVDQISAGRGGAGHFICGPISRRDFEDIVDGIDPESWQQAIIETIYEDYLQSWRTRVKPVEDACDRAQANVPRYDPSSPRSVSMDLDQLRESYRLASIAVAELETLDAEFFESLLSTCVEGQRDFIRRRACERSLAMLLRGTDALFRPRETAFIRPNIMSELEKIDLSAEESEEIARILNERTAGLLENGRQARDVRMDVEFENHRLNDEMSRRIAESNATSADYGLAFRDLSRRMAASHGEGMREWFDSESSFIDAIRTALGEKNRPLFEDIWKRASNPMVYRTGNDAGVLIDRALELDDLTDDQFVALSQVRDDHRSDWDAISGEMASVNEMLRGFGALSDEDSFESWRVLEQTFSRLEFERREIDMRALRRLSLYLRDVQRKRFPSLLDLEEASGG